MDEQQPEVFTIQLSRRDSGISWGFRLQGGLDFRTPLSIQVVQPKSVAERCGLRPGDAIVRINTSDTSGLTHEQAKMEIIRSCNDLEMTIVRGAVEIIKRKVKKPSQKKPQDAPQQQVQSAPSHEVYSPQAPQEPPSYPTESQDKLPSTQSGSYNSIIKPFKPFGAPSQPAAPPQQIVVVQSKPQPPPQQQPPQQQQFVVQSKPQQPQYGGQPQYSPQMYGGSQPQFISRPVQRKQPGSPKKAVPNVVHAQYNSPIGLYSADNIAQSYSAQTEGINKEIQGLDVSTEPVGSRMSGTYQRF